MIVSKRKLINLYPSHIFNIKNVGVLSKSASFRRNLVKCVNFRYKQWNVLVFTGIKRIVQIFDTNQWNVLVFASIKCIALVFEANQWGLIAFAANAEMY